MPLHRLRARDLKEVSEAIDILEDLDKLLNCLMELARVDIFGNYAEMAMLVYQLIQNLLQAIRQFVAQRSRKKQLDPLTDMHDGLFYVRFRFTKPEIVRVARLLLLPPTIKASNGRTATRETALCILCASFAYPHRKYAKLMELFHMSHSKLRGTWGKKIRFDRRMVVLRARMYAAALTRYQRRHGKSTVINDLAWGFIDGTVRAVCRPSHPNQNNFHNGHHQFV